MPTIDFTAGKWRGRSAALAVALAALAAALAHGPEAGATHANPVGNIGGYATACGHLTVPGPSPGFSPTVSGLPDIVQISPNIMILLDTSGSMEWMAADTVMPVCNAGSPGLTNEKNRWWQIVEALTGTIPGFSCQSEGRGTPGTRIDYHYTPRHIVAWKTAAQAADGLIDTYNGLLKFGLMTFDSYESTSTGSSGMWSYGPNKACAAGYCPVNLGARRSTAERGALISVGREDLVNVATINAMVQAEILCSIPYWGTPISPLLADAEYYFENHADVSPAGDPYHSCRERAVVLVSDGAPGMGECVDGYPCSETSAAALLADGIDVFVVGMNISSAAAITKLDDIAAAGGTTSAYFTTDLASFRTAMNGVFGALADRITSRSIPAVAPAPLSTGSLQLEFSAAVEVEGGPWKGRLERTRFDCNIDADPLTLESEHAPAIDDFGARLDTQVLRNLFTYSPDSAATKTTFDTSIPLSWIGAADATERANIVNYVLGTYIRTNKLGDIINSAPVMMSVPSLDLPMESYRAFKRFFATTPRTLMLYTGTNDGIVHAFDAESEIAAEDAELWGFVPPSILGSLETSLAGHAFLVDGPNMVMDVILRRDLSTVLPGIITDPRETGWYTVLLASLGNGGRAVYGLDVTTPDTLASVEMLFEFAATLPDSNGDGLREACNMGVADRKCDDDLGYTVGTPAMGRLVVDESGTNKELGIGMIPGGNPPEPATATAGRAMYVVALEDGHLIKKYDNTTKCSGETASFDSPIVGDVGAHSDGSGAFVTRFFAGDLAGRLWRFDTSSNDPADWCQSVFTPAAYRNGEAIYDAPSLALNEDSELVVIYGTGDIGNLLVATPDNLVISLTEKITFDPSTGAVTAITAQTNWVKYLDVGEKATGSPVVFDGCAYFATFLPSVVTPCDVGNARLWGMGYLGDDPNVAVVNDFVACFDPDPLDPADTPVVSLDLATGSLTAGVSLVRRPACVETDTIPDPTPGAPLGATVERITALTPATFVISAHIGNVGGGALPGTIPKIERTVAPPDTNAFLVSWAEIFD